MTELIAQLIVPLLALVVLAGLLATASARGRSIYGIALGTAGVVVGGPLAMLMLGSLAARAAEPTVKSNAGEKPPVENKSDEARRSSPSGSSSQSNDSSDSSDNLKIEALSIKYPSDYPDWAEADPIRNGDVHKNFVTSGPHAKRLECNRKLNEALVASTNEYIEEYIDSPGVGKYFHYDVRFIKSNLLDPDSNFTYNGEIYSDVGPMQIKHRVLRFDQTFRAQLDQQWDEIKARSRLLITLLGAGGVLGLLGTIFTYFRLDNATRGFYTGRLQFAALAAILAIVAAGVLVARWIPWM